MTDFKNFRENWKKEHSILCPHCGYEDTESEIFEEVITYHGYSDTDIKEIECSECGETFYVKEIVDRTWFTGKTEKEAIDK